MDVLAETILCQSLLQEAVGSSSGMGRGALCD